MKLSVFALFTVIVITSYSSVAKAECKKPENYLDINANNVVEVISSAGEKSGYGLLVGRDTSNGNLWIAVPGHVITGKEGVEDLRLFSSKTAKQTTVRLRGQRQRRSLCASNSSPKPAVKHDLSFICVENPGLGFVWFDGIEHLNPIAGTSLRLLGDREGIGLVDSPGRLLPSKSEAILLASGLLGIRGISGVAATSNAGIVGMHLATNADGQSELLALKEIKKYAALQNVPYTLSKSDWADCSSTASVCPNFIDATPSSTIWASPVAKKRSVEDRCLDLSSSKYTVQSTDQNVSCKDEPITIRPSNAVLRPEINCVNSLQGTWHSAEKGNMSCAQSAFDYFTCNGLIQGPGEGLLNVKGRVKNRRVTLLGNFRSVHHGSLNAQVAGRLANDRLSLTAIIGSKSFAIELKRLGGSSND